MSNTEEKYCDGVFVITEEKSCPVYNVGEELKVQDFCLSVTSYKPGCLHLAGKLTDILTVSEKNSVMTAATGPKTIFDCGGCEGIIHFEYKREKDFATLQMKMLKEADDRKNRHLIEKHFSKLRKLEIFKALDDHSLVDLTLLLEFTTIQANKRVVKKGASGNHLYIVVQGQVAVIDDDGATGIEIKTGEIFGEMSLLSGEPVSRSIHTIVDTEVAMLSLKNFRDVLRSYHKLQFYLLKILVDRAQLVSLQSGDISSGMAGKISDIGVVKLLKLMHSKSKTGALHFSLKQGKAVVFFNSGDIVFSRFATHRQQDAVYELMKIEAGQFQYTRGLPKELQKTPSIAPFDELMLEGMGKLHSKED